MKSSDVSMARLPGSRPFAGMLLALAIAELVLRFLDHGHSAYDPVFGRIFRSQAVTHRANEGWAVSHWDEDGARVAPAAVAGAPVVLALGDSYTEALQVGDDETYAADTQRMLTAAGMGVHVVNIGRGQRSPADYVALAPAFRSHYQPRWTIVQLNADDLKADSFDATKTHFAVAAGGLTVIKVVPQETRFRRLAAAIREHSALVDWLIWKSIAYHTFAQMPALFRAADNDANEREAPEETWPVESILNRVRSAYDSRVTFLYLPSFERGPTLTERRFMAYCATTGASCVDFRTVFASFRAKGEAPFGFANSAFGRGHLNASGHAAAAELLVKEIEEVRRRGLF